MKNRLYNFENLYNVRDIGGYKNSDGKLIREKKYIRGTAKGTLTPAEKELLYSDGIRVVIDLRNPYEINKIPHPLNGYKDIVYYNIDMIGSFDNMLERNYTVITQLYFDLIDYSQNQIRDVFKLLAKHENESIYYSCTAGKDRTGIITFILLSLVGIPEDEIIANYTESFENNLPLDAKAPMHPKMEMYRYSKPEYIIDTMRYIQKKYGGPEKYLQHLGISQAEIDRIKHSLLK